MPQLGGNARAGSGWLVVEGDESDRTIELLRPKIAVVTNVDLDHHSEFASRAEVEELFERWLAEVPQVVRADELEPVDLQLAVPGEHNRLNAAAALAALELAGVDPDEAAGHLAEFAGAGRRLELRGEAGGVRVLDDYAHHPAEIARRDRGRRASGQPRARPLPAAPLFAHASPGARARRRARDGGRRRRDGDLPRTRGAHRRRQRQARRRRRDGDPSGDDRRLDAVGRGRCALPRPARAKPATSCSPWAQATSTTPFRSCSRSSREHRAERPARAADDGRDRRARAPLRAAAGRGRARGSAPLGGSGGA